MLSTHAPYTARALARLLCAWLGVIVLLQALAAAGALVHGPLHRHRDSADAAHAALHHADGAATRHHHAHDDARVSMTVLGAIGDPGLDPAAQSALAAAFCLLALGAAWRLRDTRRHVWHAARPWVPCMALAAPPKRPPRA